MNDTIEQKIAAKTDFAVAGSTEVSSAVGGLAFKDMGQVMEFSKLMAVSGQAVPKHLRGTPGACLAVSLQALNWRMDPFAVANKSYMVNDRIAYEAQLIQAVIEQRAPIKGRLKGKYVGEGPTRQVVLTAISEEDGDEIVYTSPKFGEITTKNSPLWKSDPDQQLWYYAARAMCRRHFPDVLLGVYEKEEIEQAEGMRDVTPKEPGGFAQKAVAARAPVDTPEPEEAAPTPAESVEDAELVPDEDQTPETKAEDVSQVEPDPHSLEYAEGRTAHQDGAAHIQCPYDDYKKQLDWLSGWWDRENSIKEKTA